MIAGKHFAKDTIVECDDADAAILFNIKRAVKATPEDIREYLSQVKKPTVAKQAPREIGEADATEAAAATPEEAPKGGRRR